jgi:CheY-like chemotaxis protein
MARSELFMPEGRIMVQGSGQVLGAAIDHLLRNAVESMDKRGLVRIDLALERVDRGGALLKAGLYAVIRIRDQGTGIREEHMKHIFEPYFSTKPGHQGLGLSSALAAASEHGGTVRIYSNFGTGTEAVVYLPATLEEEATRQVARSTNRLLNRKRILVMDDERFVREFVIALLDQLGYEAVATKDGDELMEEFRASCRIRKPYHAVITDLLVPEGKGGESLPEKLRKLDQGVKIIVTSGFANHPALLRYRDYGFDGALSKPFRAEVLKETLETLIGASKT